MKGDDSLKGCESAHDEPYDACLEEKSLLGAILERTILDYLELSCEKSDTASAREWVQCYKEHPFSFHWCCIQLSMEPTAVRKMLTQISELPKETLREGNRFDTYDRLGMLVETNKKQGRLNSVTRFNLLKKRRIPLQTKEA